jgi:hypothetical protein
VRRFTLLGAPDGCGSSSSTHSRPGPGRDHDRAADHPQRLWHVWDDLLSTDRAVAPRKDHVACESSHPVGVVPRALRVLRVGDEGTEDSSSPA